MVLTGKHVAGLLRRGVGRGQLRHRRLRPGDGPERPGAVLGAEPDRPPARCCSPTTSTPTSRPGERYPRPAETTDPLDRDVRIVPARAPGQRRSPRSARSSPPTANQDRKKPFDIRTVINAVADQDHAILERWAGMADADTSVVVDAHLGGYPVTVLGIESRPIPRRGFLPGRRPGPVDRGHAVPAVVEEDRAGDQRRQRQPAAGGAGEPVRVRRLTGVAAQHPAGVRRRDRPGHRQLRRPDHLLRGLPLPRRRVRGVLRSAERQHGGDRRRGLVRLGDRRRTGRGRGVHPRGQHPHRRRPAGQGAEAAAAAADGVDQAQLRVELATCAARCGRRSSARWRPSSSRSTTSSGPREVGSVHAIIPAAELRPWLIAAVERGMARADG